MAPGSTDRSREERLGALLRGAEAEAAVGAALEDQGFTVVARNWHGGGSEIDLIVRRGDALRFVEVKARDELDWNGFEAITEEKQRRLTCAAEAWLAENVPTGEACFLAALVTLAATGEASIELVDNAWDG